MSSWAISSADVANERRKLGVVLGVATGSTTCDVKGDRERLIPFTEQVVKEVDLERGVIHVDWGSDY